MDIQMPEMDGYTSTGILRDELHSSIPVLAMTAHAMAGEKEKCLSYGMNDYISKPIKETELYNLILQYLNLDVDKDVKNNSAVIDLDYLHDLSKGNKNFETEMIRQFMVQVPEEINSLKVAIDQKDFPAVTSIAHGLKSSVSFMGLSAKLEPVLQQIEINAANKNLNVVRQGFEQLQKVCSKALAEAKLLLL